MADEQSRQQRVGAASRAVTRQRLLEAASAEFVERGYTKATVAAIAERAGVTVQTLYLAWGSKRELLRGYLEESLGVATPPAELTGTPREAIAQLSALFVKIAERSAPAWALYRDAAAVDPEIADDWSELQSLRRGTFERLLKGIPKKALRVDRRTAVDTAWTIASPETYDLLVRRAGYDLGDFGDWVNRTLAAALLA